MADVKHTHENEKNFSCGLSCHCEKMFSSLIYRSMADVKHTQQILKIAKKKTGGLSTGLYTHIRIIYLSCHDLVILSQCV